MLRISRVAEYLPSLNPPRLEKNILNNALFVGIDVSSKDNVAFDGDKYSSFSVPNNSPGAEALVDRIAAVLKQLFLFNVCNRNGINICLRR